MSSIVMSAGRVVLSDCHVLQGPQCPLQTRILFHCAHKTGQEEKLVECHQQLGDSLEDQLSLASIHYLRGHYQVLEAVLHLSAMLINTVSYMLRSDTSTAEAASLMPDV